MKSIAFFNNKGGVGKTTLACNVVAYLNMKRGKRVLLVDADPQCNATQAMLDDGLCEEMYTDDKTTIQTLYSALRPLEIGEPSIDGTIKPVSAHANRFHTDVIPGHPKMSVVEGRLSDAWSALKGRDIRGYRITNWAAHLTNAFRDHYDLIVFDVGPSLGALNRSVILASDYIVTPFGCDIFSLIGIKNITGWINDWKAEYDEAIAWQKVREPKLLDDLKILQDTDAQFRFAGYSVQQYVQRKFASGPRPVKSYDTIMAEIPGTVLTSMKPFVPAHLVGKELQLGDIPYLYSLVPMAQAAKAPIHDLQSADGLVGSQYSQVRDYDKLMGTLCDKLLGNLELA